MKGLFHVRPTWENHTSYPSSFLTVLGHDDRGSRIRWYFLPTETLSPLVSNLTFPFKPSETYGPLSIQFCFTIKNKNSSGVIGVLRQIGYSENYKLLFSVFTENFKMKGLLILKTSWL